MSSAHSVLVHTRFTHVHSHQDKTTAFDELSFPAQLNVLCDTMATTQMHRQAVKETERTLSIPLLPRNLNVAVMYNQQVILSHYVARLRECISLHNHRIFLQTKYKWSDQVWSSIAWDAFMTCARKPALLHSVNRSKIVHNWLHLGTQRVKFGTGGNTLEIARRCPYCQQEEDFTHMLTCDDPRAKKFRYDAAIPLRTVLSKSGDAGTFLLRAIQVWTQTPLDPINIVPADEARGIQPAIDQALDSQTQIGWVQFFRGFVSLDWGLIYPQTDIHRLTPEDRRAQSEKNLDCSDYGCPRLHSCHLEEQKRGSARIRL
jgi:hypothetical protein